MFAHNKIMDSLIKLYLSKTLDPKEYYLLDTINEFHYCCWIFFYTKEFESSLAVNYIELVSDNVSVVKLFITLNIIRMLRP